MEYTFKSQNGYCPQCVAFGRIYYIQDRYIGEGKYEYALMSGSLEKKIPRKYLNAEKMVSSLIGSEYSDDIASVNLLLSQMTFRRCGPYRLIEHDGIKYVWDELKKELREYTEPKQETGYCDTYLECLNMAKEILKAKEQEINGTQLNLFG